MAQSKTSKTLNTSNTPEPKANKVCKAVHFTKEELTGYDTTGMTALTLAIIGANRNKKRK